jgi:GNAT superfamily N-acetyltransferase
MSGGPLSPAQFLEWDTAFFGFRIARLAADRLTPQAAVEALNWCDREHIRCLYFLACADDPATIGAAQDYGFRLTDIRITMEHTLHSLPPAPAGIRNAHPDDVRVLSAIAAVSHHDSRFYADPGFPEQCCDALYRKWIERSCEGYADAVLVGEQEDQPAGYITCHLQPPVSGSIGLTAVAEEARGRGLGRRLVEGALHFCAARGAQNVTVVTQGRNCGAQRLYQGCGFRTRSLQLWYHRWFPATEENEFISHTV